MKKESFWNMLEQTEPDIIIASETWLHQGILEREVLPENYRFVARRDRLKSAHRRVAVIAKSDLEGVEVGTPSDTEFVAASFTCKYLKKPLIVGSLYRPPGNNQKYAEDLCRTISSLSALYRDSTIWIGGDANLPDIEWDTTSIKGNRYTIPINNTIINTMFDAGCEQVVNFATKAVNTLDLFFTNRPSLVNKCLPLPGLSDHDIVLVDTNITPARQKPLKRVIYLWKKVNITNMANNLKVSLDKFMDCSDIKKTPINIPQPDIVNPSAIGIYVDYLDGNKGHSTNIAKQEKRKTGTDIANYRNRPQKECKSSYNEYVNDMVSQDSGNQKLFTFIKNKKCENSGIAP